MGHLSFPRADSCGITRCEGRRGRLKCAAPVNFPSAEHVVGACPTVPDVAIYQELSGQGRVVGGHLANGSVLSGGTTPFSKNSDLSIQHTSNPFKRHRINSETIREWEELPAKDGVMGAVGRAAASAAIPGRIGKAVGAGLGAAVNSGHTVRVTWVDGKQSIIELPEKQYMVLSVLMGALRIATEPPESPTTDLPVPTSGVGETITDLAASVLSRRRQAPPSAETSPTLDVSDQITKLAALHAQGILTDSEFSEKKAELLKRL